MVGRGFGIYNVLFLNWSTGRLKQFYQYAYRRFFYETSKKIKKVEHMGNDFFSQNFRNIFIEITTDYFQDFDNIKKIYLGSVLVPVL